MLTMILSFADLGLLVFILMWIILGKSHVVLLALVAIFFAIVLFVIISEIKRAYEFKEDPELDFEFNENDEDDEEEETEYDTLPERPLINGNVSPQKRRS